MSNELAEVFPNPLSFCLTDNNKKISLTLRNLTNEYILYKFMINTRGVLLAKPPTSFIPPSQSISIDVHLINSDLPLEDYLKTKLLIMFIQSDEEIQSIDQAKKKFQLLKNEENEKQEILVNLDIINEQNENHKEEDEKITYMNYAQLKTELTEKNNEIKKNIENFKKKYQNLINEDNKGKGKRKKSRNMNNNFLIILIILAGLILGANVAYRFNKLFNKK